MILADTTIWCTHLVKSKVPDPRFKQLIADRQIVCHPWVFGELLLAGLRPDVAVEILELDFLPVAGHMDVVRFVNRYHPQGVGWVDVHLLVSCLDGDTKLWTNDKGLRANADLHGRGISDPSTQ